MSFVEDIIKNNQFVLIWQTKTIYSIHTHEYQDSSGCAILEVWKYRKLNESLHCYMSLPLFFRSFPLTTGPISRFKTAMSTSWQFTQPLFRKAHYCHDFPKSCAVDVLQQWKNYVWTYSDIRKSVKSISAYNQMETPSLQECFEVWDFTEILTTILFI